jgi:hypothetical protein
MEMARNVFYLSCCKMWNDTVNLIKIFEEKWNIIIKNYHEKWQEHLERITNNSVLKLSYLNKLKCSNARDIVRKME